MLLVGCWPRGYHTNFATGTGRVWATHAVMGVGRDISFSEVNGIRSEISGLREWLGVSSTSEVRDMEARTTTLTGESAEPVEVNSDLTLIPQWSTERPDGDESILLRDYVTCETRSATPRPWDDLSGSHRGVRDLLVIARWRKETCTTTLVTRADDPLTTLDGAEHGEQWRTVVSARRENPPAPVSGYRPYLLEYDDIGGAAGIARWLDLRDEFSRALDPILSDRYLERLPAVTHLAQVGPGLEALGYLLLKNRDGVGSAKAKASTLRERLDRITEAVDGALPFDGATWAAGMTSAYNAIKHANRTLPDEIDLLNRWQESNVVVRAWVAVELGVPTPVVKRRLELDPSAGGFTAR